MDGLTEVSPTLTAVDFTAVNTPSSESPSALAPVIVPLSEAAIAFITIPLILLIVTAFGK